MSFDLFVLVEQFDASVQQRWIQKLRQLGIACEFPSGFVLDRDADGDTLARCVIGPPLVPVAWPASEIGISAAAGDADPGELARMVERSDDPQLRAKLQRATIEFHFSSAAGREDDALLVQCYGAAALADVGDGVLVDPQEAGAVHGAQVYAVARANSDWVIEDAE
jgi:hypothetical protein